MSTTGTPGAPDDVVRIFVSYAREDRKWLDPKYSYSLIPFLVESLRRHNVVFWFDKELKPGDEFTRFIESEIDQSQIALLIVSQSFLNSEFIENKEMPRIAERARLGKMIVVPVLVEPCDWSEYPFLADRQMVPSSPLIDYTESPPQWVKVRFQILDGLKAQLKRIREAPQPHAQKAQASAPEELPSASATSAVAHAIDMPRAIPEPRNATEQNADPLKREKEARSSEPVLLPEAEPDVSRGSSKQPDAVVVDAAPAPADFSRPASALTETAPEVSGSSKPMRVPTFGMTNTSLEPLEEWIEDQAQDSAKKRNMPRIRKWIIAAAAAAALVTALVLLAIRISHGKPWTVRDSGTTRVLDSIFGASDGRHLWASGERGTILESDDGGATWKARESGTTEDLESIFGASDGEHVWAAGGYGTILESNDEGVSWAARNSGSTYLLLSISGTSDGKRLCALADGAIDGGAILESEDGGASWMGYNSGAFGEIKSVFETSDGEHSWVVGDNGAILEVRGAGATWAVHKSGTANNLTSIFVTQDGKKLWAVGTYGAIFESDDGGVTWSARNSGTKDNFYSIFGTSDGQLLWVVGDEGTILESVDGGANWKKRNSGTKAVLRSVFGTSDGRQVWVVGDDGTILESDR